MNVSSPGFGGTRGTGCAVRLPALVYSCIKWGERNVSMTSGSKTTRQINIKQEMSAFSKRSDERFLAALKALEHAAAAERAELVEMAGSAERAQNEFQRSEEENQATHAELQQTRQHLRVAQDELDVVRAELDETKARLATAEASKLTVEAHNTKLGDEVSEAARRRC